MPLRSLCPALLALAACALPLSGVDDSSQPSKEYLQQKAELEEMVSKRDIDLFELQFTPGKLDRIVLRDRAGHDHVFNYLTFTVRNQTVLDAAQLALRAKGYNEVLQAVAQQYDKVKVEAEGGGKLSIDGVTGADGVVIERTESKLKTRTVSLTVVAADERGTRIRLLDDPPGSGPQETFAFADLGEPQAASVFTYVKEKIEEREGRRLLTTDELRRYPLPPFDGTARVEAPNIEDPQHDFNGWFVGEARGVIIFTRLSDYGNTFDLQIHGLSNKLRFRTPSTEAGKPENYFQSRILRHTYVARYHRPGDEFYRDLDRFDLVKGGYSWVDSFQRTDIRRMISYSRYFLGSIADEKGVINGAVKDQFWPYYDEQRAANPKLPDLKADLAAPQ